MLPHTLYNPDPWCLEQYFPGPDFWNVTVSSKAPRDGLTTGICNVPVHAMACWHIYDHGKDKISGLRFLRDMFPKLVAWHNYLYRERDPHNEGLVYCRHMWENGTDNSPMWDEALNSMDLTPDMIPEYTRKDILHADPAHRPTKFFYDRVVYLIKLFEKCKYDEAEIRKSCPFLTQDVLFNAALARSGRDLARIAVALGEDPTPFLKQVDRTNTDMNNKLWNGSMYCDFNMVSGNLNPHRTSLGFTPLVSGAPTSAMLQTLVDNLKTDEFGT